MMRWQIHIDRIIVFVGALLLTGCGGEQLQPKVQAVDDFFKSLPSQARDWKTSNQDATYDRRTIFNYLDGGAELYLTYDFRKAYVRRFAKVGDPESEITVDVFDMGISAEAFGVFTAECEDEGVGIGQDSEYGGGLLRFWKDRYFVSITALGDAEQAKPAMLELGCAVAAAIPSTGSRPAILSKLPTAALVEREVRYFHSMNVLNNHHFVATDNILNLGRETQCVLARYKADGSHSYLLMVQYPSDSLAQEAFKRFLDAYLPEARATGYAQLENQRWAMAKRQQNMCMVVFEAPDKQWAERLLQGISSTER